MSVISKIKICLYLALLAVSMTISGCGGRPQAAWPSGEAKGIYGDKKLENAEGKLDEEILDIIAAAGGDIGLETIRQMVISLGKEGYVAVDSENQIDMAGAKKAADFCRMVDAGQEAELEIFEILYTGGFRKYELSTKGGRVEAVERYYQCDSNGIFRERNTARYPADSWQLTQEGYLMFEGNYDSEESYTLTLSENVEYAAFRVQPLDEKCRELNRKYILPVGYSRNNMFLVDWDETDFGELNFYDLFDALYPLRFGRAVPYGMGENLESGVVCRIPEGEFENVIMPYFKINSQTLRSKTDYLSKDQVYRYRPRGFHNAEYPDIPYPEVVSYVEKDGGILELTVNAVYPHDNTSKAFSHIVTVRLPDEGGFQYVSNQVVFPEEGYEAWWHGER